MSRRQRGAGRPGTGAGGQALGHGKSLRLEKTAEQKLDGIALSDFGGNWALATRTIIDLGLRVYLDAKFEAAGLRVVGEETPADEPPRVH